QYEEAISYYKQCLEIEPDYEPAQKDLKACKEALQNS
ncbi:MAG: hypothetical protein GWN62_04805, partial [Aliifodinibius sp.]|nr:hypothetical protein [Fodinibius sp.]